MGRKSKMGGVTAEGPARIRFDLKFEGERYRPTLHRSPTQTNLRRAPSKPRIWHWIWHLHPPCTHCRPCAQLKPCGQDACFAYIFLGWRFLSDPPTSLSGAVRNAYGTVQTKLRLKRTFPDRGEACVRATFRIGTWHGLAVVGSLVWWSCERGERRPGARERIHRAAARAVDMIDEAGFCDINHLERGGNENALDNRGHPSRSLAARTRVLIYAWRIHSYSLGHCHRDYRHQSHSRSKGTVACSCAA